MQTLDQQPRSQPASRQTTRQIGGPPPPSEPVAHKAQVDAWLADSALISTCWNVCNDFVEDSPIIYACWTGFAGQSDDGASHMSEASSSLFGLISLAGSASLGELRARSSGDARSLAQQLAGLLRDGSVALTASEDFTLKDRLADRDQKADRDPNFYEVMGLIQAPTSGALNELVRTHEDVFTKAIQTALSDDAFATSITVSPTSRGFRRRL